MKYNYINLTPHDVVIYTTMEGLVFDNTAKCYRVKEGYDAKEIRHITIPSSGVSRCTMNQSEVDSDDGIALVTTSFGEIQNLPDPVEGTIYIVSSIVALAARSLGRTDVAIVTGMVKSEDGRTIFGCTSLSIG